jgi:hypothetical protein
MDLNSLNCIRGFLKDFDKESVSVKNVTEKYEKDDPDSLKKVITSLNTHVDTHPNFGVFHVCCKDMKYPFLLVFTSYSPDNYKKHRMHIFTEDKKQALGEFCETEESDDQTILLLPRYVPRKRDKKNILRKEYFENEYGSLEVAIPLQTRDFFTSLCFYVERRIRADNLIGKA